MVEEPLPPAELARSELLLAASLMIDASARASVVAIPGSDDYRAALRGLAAANEVVEMLTGDRRHFRPRPARACVAASM